MYLKRNINVTNDINVTNRLKVLAIIATWDILRCHPTATSRPPVRGMAMNTTQENDNQHFRTKQDIYIYICF